MKKYGSIITPVVFWGALFTVLLSLTLFKETEKKETKRIAFPLFSPAKVEISNDGGTVCAVLIDGKITCMTSSLPVVVKKSKEGEFILADDVKGITVNIENINSVRFFEKPQAKSQQLTTGVDPVDVYLYGSFTGIW